MLGLNDTRRWLTAIAVSAVAWSGSAHGASAGGTAASAPRVTVTELARHARTTSGAAIVMPSGPLEVVTSRYEIPPGASLPPHLHPFPRYAYVLSGVLQVTNLRTGAAHLFRPGDLIVEDVKTWHKARAIGDRRVRLLVFDFAPPGSKNTIVR